MRKVLKRMMRLEANNSARAFSYLETDTLSSVQSEKESNSSLLILLLYLYLLVVFGFIKIIVIGIVI